MTPQIQLKPTIAETRTRIWEKANPKLREEIEWFKNEFERIARDSLRWHYAIGLRFRKIYDDEKSGRRTYGLSAVKRIAAYFQLDVTVLYHCLKLANEFTQAEFDKLCELRMSNGQPISYSHALLFSSVKAPERQRIIDSSVAQSWTCERILQEIEPESKKNKPPNDGRGRPLAIPRDLDSMLNQIGSFADDFLERATRVWESEDNSLSVKYGELSPDEHTSERAQRAKVVVDKLEKLANSAKRLRDTVQLVQNKFLKSLEQQPEPKLITDGKK